LTSDQGPIVGEPSSGMKLIAGLEKTICEGGDATEWITEFKSHPDRVKLRYELARWFFDFKCCTERRIELVQNFPEVLDSGSDRDLVLAGLQRYLDIYAKAYEVVLAIKFVSSKQKG
jgi:hypothetical protein